MRQATKITKGGRLIIPVYIRKALKLTDGSSMILSLEEGVGFKAIPVRESIRRAQALCQPYMVGAGSLSEELIQERRAEALLESEQG
jgi:bifunctional DNA-binding transcriptional regulator/antitoxin component of YhaV-PrlF toxin-antitoxin module